MSIQLFIILVYLAVTVLIGSLAKKRLKGAASFSGCGLGVSMCVAAGTGEWLGGTATMGVSEYGYIFGLSGAWFTVANGIGIVVLALFFAGLYRRLNVGTVPAILGRYLGQNAQATASVFLIFVMIAVGTAQILAAGTLGVTVLDIDFSIAVIILGMAFIAYTLIGGMVAVGYTNMMHLIAMFSGVIFALLYVMKGNGGWAHMQQQLPMTYFSPTSIGLPKISSWLIASVLGACTAQAGIQPILAAKNETVAKKAALITAFVVAPFGVLTALLGIASRLRFADLPNAKLALPALLMDLNPAIGGVILSTILAAVLSTISLIILASGTMFTRDIYHTFINRNASDQKLLAVMKVSTGLSGLVCIGFAILLYGGATILDIVYFAYTLRGALFVILLFGIYWQGTSPQGAIWAMISTGVVGSFWIIFNKIHGTYPIHPALTETYASVIVAGMATFILSFFFRTRESRHSPSSVRTRAVTIRREAASRP